MELGLYQKQTMNLVMTTQLSQAISLLQLSTVDLSQFIQEQSIENPLIELEEKSTKIRLEERYASTKHKSYSSNDDDESVSPLDFIPNDGEGLCENLMEQVKWLHISDREQSILNYLILNLDENGYLPITNEEIKDQLALNEEEVEYNIQLLQQLEPVGVGARDLRECLLLQVQEYHQDEPLVASVITDYLEMLSEKKWKKISLELDIPLLEVKRIEECIQTLDPRPCSKLTNPSTRYLFPDITVEKEDGEYVISMNDNYLPTIQVNQQYMSLLNKKNDSSKYVKDSYQKYLWLVKSIEQRRSTILKIAEFVVRKQRYFLENGFASLHAMTLKEVANEIEMHESTVSRAISNKVIQTPTGSFEMKKLFTSKLGIFDGSEISSAKVKILLKKFIAEEDKRKPYSDQKISDYFKKRHGITISRRTVAKYREELNILSSSKRKLIVQI